MADLVSVAEAAKRLTAAGDKIDRSGLSHYLKRHAAALPTTKQSGRLTLVDFDKLSAHRRAHLGRDLVVNGEVASGLSLADEQQGKLRADRLLAVDRLTKRKADLVSMLVAQWMADAAVVALGKALDAAAGETAALMAVEHGGDIDMIRHVLLDHGRQAHAAMVTALLNAGFLNTTPKEMQELAALLPANEPEPPEPQNLDEERAAKARMDRLRQELTLLESRRVMIPRQDAEFALVDAFQTAKQALATAAREGVEILARAAGVEPVFVRRWPRLHEKRVLALFRPQLRLHTRGQPEASQTGAEDNGPE